MPGTNGTGMSSPAPPPAPGKRQARPRRSRWGIVLAGGEGTRMGPVIRSWCGAHYPKQYCTFTGSRTMFRHTIDRAATIVPGENVVSVIGRGHRKYLAGRENGEEPGHLIEQPGDRGTATGVFLSVAYVLSVAPDATVLLLPSGHFVLTEERFCGEMRRAMELAETHPGQIVLAGAIPDRRDGDNVWIDPGETRPGNGRAPDGPPHLNVARFHENPSARESRALLRRGALWNTTIVAARASTLWALGRQLLPETMVYFDAFLTVLRAVRERRLEPGFEAKALKALYGHVAPADFTMDVLQRASMDSLAMRMEGVYWCDWQRPQQVADSLALLGRRPPFGPEPFTEAASANPELARAAGHTHFSSRIAAAVNPNRRAGA